METNEETESLDERWENLKARITIIFESPPPYDFTKLNEDVNNFMKDLREASKHKRDAIDLHVKIHDYL